MPPLLFQLVALLIAIGALATAAFPRQLGRWQMRGPAGNARIEPGTARLLMMRVMGVVVAVLALLVAFGSPSLLQ